MPRCIAEFLHSIPGSFCPGAGADDAGRGRYTTEQDLREGLTAIKDAARLQGVN